MKDLALEDFVTAIDDFKNKIKLSYAKDWKKGVKNFTKNLVKLTKGSVNTLKQSLFKLGNEATKQNKSGKKKTGIGKLIPIQAGLLDCWEEDQRTKSKEPSYWLAATKTMCITHCQIKRNLNEKMYIH